jgi:hypothetical protein
MQNYTFLLSLKEKYKADIELTMPVFYFEGKFLNDKGDLENNLRQIIAGSLSSCRAEGGLPKQDLVARFKEFGPLAIIGAGLADGINPCAFTVIVFFISFLALQGYRKKEIIVIGLCFILAVFVTYLLIGLGIFNFIYRIRGFWVIAKAINIGIGLFSIILGTLAIYDFFKFKKTGQTEGLYLQLPKAVKDQIHSLIGLHYRKTKDSGMAAGKTHIFRLILTALTTGFMVSLLEAVCTGQLYLPTITFILKTTSFKFQALGYLLLYNLMFITPLLAIFLFALLGVTSEQFARFLKSNLASIKLLMAAIFFGLGILLIWRF